MREVRPVTRKNVHTDLRNVSKGEPILYRLITPIPQGVSHLDEGWLDLDREAVVEVTSGEKDYPVESALVGEESWG